jgi:hypothetical protein
MLVVVDECVDDKSHRDKGLFSKQRELKARCEQ